MTKLITGQSVIDLMKQTPNARLQANFARDTYKIIDGFGEKIAQVSKDAWGELCESNVLCPREMSRDGKQWRYGIE